MRVKHREDLSDQKAMGGAARNHSKRHGEDFTPFMGSSFLLSVVIIHGMSVNTGLKKSGLPANT